MNNKYKFIASNIFITIISIYFTYAVYFEYKESQEKKINAYIDKSINRNKTIIINTFQKIKNEIESDRRLFKKIHTEYTLKFRENHKLDIRKLKEEILNKYDLTNKDIHLFLLNSDYTITDATYKPDIGFKLGLIPDARLELDKTHDGSINQSYSVSIDIINSEIKSYSYSKINDSLYFEMGFINKKIQKILKDTMTKIRIVTNQNTNLYRIEKKLDGNEYFDSILEKRTSKTKEEYISSKKMFHEDKNTNNPIILANRLGENLKYYTEDSLKIYIPLIKKSNEYLELMGDFVLELYIDRTYEIILNKKIDLYFYIFLFFHILFLLIIYYFTKKYYESLVELEETSKKNEKLFDNNKDFIISIKNQIKTPLSVIMSNIAFVERYINKDYEKYLQQINSAIDMLNNSHNDLTYLANDEKINYTSTNLNISEFLENRVFFFENISKIKNKIIHSEIEKNLYYFINETELERLIDNNISNAINHSDENSELKIKLFKQNKQLLLSFYSKGKKIKDVKKIFERNYKEKNDSKRSLGLGLSMINSICKKYDIEYDVKYKDENNIFTYIFKET